MDSTGAAVGNVKANVKSEFASPRSRYGRNQKPKVSQDFYNLDHIVIEAPKTQSPARSMKQKASILKSPVVFEELRPKAETVKNCRNSALELGGKGRTFLKRTRTRGMGEEVTNVVNVNNVFKVIARQTAKSTDKKSTKNTIRTYSNKRKRFYKNIVVESFGLPDEPIIPTEDSIKLIRHKKIDVDLGVAPDINLDEKSIKPWVFDDYQSQNCVSEIWRKPQNNETGFSENKRINKSMPVNLDKIIQNEDVLVKKNPKIKQNKSVHKMGKELNVVVEKLIDKIPLTEQSTTLYDKQNQIFKSNYNKTITNINSSVKNSESIKNECSEITQFKKRLRSSGSSDLHPGLGNRTNRRKSKKVNLIQNQQEESANKYITGFGKHTSGSTDINPEIVTFPTRNENSEKNLEQNSTVQVKLEIGVFEDSPQFTTFNSDVTLSPKHNKIEIKEEIQEESQLTTINKEKGNFEIGDIVWAKIGTHPYWPCLMVAEPGTEIHRKLIANRLQPLYHVRFFGDRGRRSWVRENYIMPYSGADDLEKIAIELKVENKLSRAQINESYVVKQNKLPKWLRGVEEAELLKGKKLNERLNYFFEIFAGVREKKRKLREMGIDKKEIEKILDRERTKPVKRKREVKNVRKIDDKGGKKKMPKRKKKKNVLENDGDEIDLTVKSRQLSNCDSNSDNESKFSDNSSIPSSIKSQVALYKRNNIFRGVPKEKVCQVCEKSIDVFKCKGPCNGVYHYNCAMSSNKNDDIIKYVELTSILTPTKNENSSSFNLCDSNLNSMSLAEKIDFRMKEIMKKFDGSVSYSDSNGNNKNGQFKKKPKIIKHITADVDINYKINIERNDDPILDDKKEFKCRWCYSKIEPPCLICNNQDESKGGASIRQKCSLHPCGKYYHPECVKIWPQTQWSLMEDKKDTFVCPRHVCHTCVSDDPRASNSRCSSDKVVKCLKCPSTYHSSNYCVPAGTEILTSSQIICPRHFADNGVKRKKIPSTINTTWCFICSKGGNLICCETCPTSVHKECLPGDLDVSKTFYCEDCQSGRLPLYDEIVWVKLGAYRWWPALILFPNEIPAGVRNKHHNIGEFVVKFYGTYDHYWVGRGRTFLFQEGDKGQTNPIKKRVDNAFMRAVQEATSAHKLKNEFKSNKIAVKNQKPPPYIRIKSNKPVGNVRLFDGNISNTTSCDCDPHEPFPCGPDTDCLNRLLLTECNPEVCPAGIRCNNQCFEKREYPPLTPYKTGGRGWGLKTLAPIRKGDFVIEYVGEMINEHEYQRRLQKMHEQKEENYYFLTIDKDRMLDAGPKGNVSRFMNHSCQPNCETQKWTVNGDTRVGLFATIDIATDTELTFNYNLECIGKERKICKCGAPNCSGFIGVKVKSEESTKKTTVKRVNNKNKKKKTTILSSPSLIEQPCFICGKFGNVGACNNKICNHFYHLECVGLIEWSEKWICPWHNCKLCSKRTIRCCVKCINSYCPTHSEGNIRHDKLLGFVCKQHDPTKEDIKLHEIWNTNTTEEETAVTSTITVEEEFNSDLNCTITSTPLKNHLYSSPENEVSSATPISNMVGKSKNRKGRNIKKMKEKKYTIPKQLEIDANLVVSLKNTANIFNVNEVKLSKFTSDKYMRTTRNNGCNGTFFTEKDLPIRKRTRLRCENTI